MSAGLPTGVSPAELERYEKATAVLLDQARAARHSIGAFVDFTGREETTKARIQAAPHQRVLLEFAMAHEESVIRMPVGHTKTFSMAMLAEYQLGLDPTMRGVVVSATQGQAAKPVGMVADDIKENPWLHLVFPALQPSKRRSDKWTDTAITVDRPPGIRDASLMAVGIDGAIDGARLNFCNVDDILNRENTATKDGRDKVFDWFEGSVLSRMDPRGSRVCVTNVPWHPDDLVHRLTDMGWPTLVMTVEGVVRLHNTDWDHELLRPATPNSYECRLVGLQDTDTLWPHKYGRDEVEGLRRKYTPQRFNQLYMMDTRDDSTAMCQQQFIDRCKDNALRERVHELASMPTRRDCTFTGVDLAVGLGEENDETALFTFEVLPTGLRRILDIDAGRWSGPDIIKKIAQKHRQYGSVVRVENNAAQDYIRQFTLQHDIGIPIKAHTTGRAKAHPEYGVPGLFIEMANGAWIIPCDVHRRCHPLVQRWIDACLYYSPAKHTDDILMACYFAREQAKEFGVATGADTASMNQGGSGPSVGMGIMAR